MAGVEEAPVLGVGGPRWSEHSRSLTDMQFMVLTRTLSRAEVGWAPQAKRNYSDFTDRPADEGIYLITQDTTFQAIPELQDWLSGFAPAPIGEDTDGSDVVLIAHVAAPAPASSDDRNLTATVCRAHDPSADSTAQLRFEMARGYEPPNGEKSEGRVMNSLIAVYAKLSAFTEAGTYEVTVEGTNATPDGLSIDGSIDSSIDGGAKFAIDGSDSDDGAGADDGQSGSDAGQSGNLPGTGVQPVGFVLARAAHRGRSRPERATPRPGLIPQPRPARVENEVGLAFTLECKPNLVLAGGYRIGQASPSLVARNW